MMNQLIILAGGRLSTKEYIGIVKNKHCVQSP